MREVSQTAQFGRDLKKMKKRGKDLAKLRRIVSILAAGKTLDAKHRDHVLAGEWSPARDCHVEPDWILIYSIDKATLKLERTLLRAPLHGPLNAARTRTPIASCDALFPKAPISRHSRRRKSRK
ncbi:MAG: type II toxin-antitoxin system YafQ family toxin [Verrucomicrobia bacterium]|nr:type II toxin-antitoxin system YafQ family toxin [Verrucomicrobiota bacterium]